MILLIRDIVRTWTKDGYIFIKIFSNNQFSVGLSNSNNKLAIHKIQWKYNISLEKLFLWSVKSLFLIMLVLGSFEYIYL